MGRYGKKTAMLIVLLPPFLSACNQRSHPELEDPSLREGKSIFRLWCAKCHSVVRDGERSAPDLSGVGARLTAERLQRMILEPSLDYPGTIMPPDDHFSLRERGALVRYLSTLTDAGEDKDSFKSRVKDLLARLRHAVGRS